MQQNGRSLWIKTCICIQNEEFVFLRLAGRHEIFPTLYGTCGSLYVVEALEPLPSSDKLIGEKSLSSFIISISNYKIRNLLYFKIMILYSI